MKKGRRYFQFQKALRSPESPKLSNNHCGNQEQKGCDSIGQAPRQHPVRTTYPYPHVKKPPRAENRTQPGREKTVYGQLIDIRESIAQHAKIPRSNEQCMTTEAVANAWTKDICLVIARTSQDLELQLRNTVQKPIMIPGNSPLGAEWIGAWQYPRIWTDIFPHLSNAKFNVQPYEKDQDKVTTDAINLNRLAEAICKQRDDRGRPYNCLDLPDQFGIKVFPNEIDQVNIARLPNEESIASARTSSKGSDLTFNILSMRDSFTPPHVDAGGYLTFVHMLKGKKIWYLLNKSLPDMSPEDKERLTEGGFPALVEHTQFEWSRILLAKGDSLWV